MGIFIERIGVHLPQRVVSTEEIVAESGRGKADKLTKFTGVRTRHICAPDETALDLATEACRKVLDAEAAQTVDFVIYCTQTPEYYLPSSACLLQQRLNLPQTVGALDINLGCSGFVNGLALAKGLVSGGLASTVLLVNTDTLTKFVNPLDQSNRIIFGDAATACLLRRCDEEHVHAFSFGTDGRGASSLIVPNGAMRHRYDPNAELMTDENGNQYTANDIYMSGPDIFNFTIEAVPVLVADVLRRNGAQLEDLDYIIFHQANRYILDYLRKLIGIPAEKFHNDLETTGNTSSATIPLALADGLAKRTLRQGHRVLLAGFGVGFSWAGVVITI